MLSKLENLSVEIWLEIFCYLKIRDQFNSFFNLNHHLNQILFSYRTQISWKNNDDDAQFLSTNLLKKLVRKDQVTSFRLENTKHIDLDDHMKLFHFPCLQTFIIHRLNINQAFLNIFAQNTNYLRCLKISSVVSVCKKDRKILINTILSLPNLEICSVKLGIIMYRISYQSSMNSPIKHLRLIGENEICFTDRLSQFLKHLPNLQSLYIRADQLSYVPINDSLVKSNYQVPISTFRFDLNQLNISLIEFSEFLHYSMFNIKYLNVRCHVLAENFDYLSYQDWMKFIRLMPSLHNIILNIPKSTRFNQQIWEKKCNLLQNLVNLNHVDFKIHSQ